MLQKVITKFRNYDTKDVIMRIKAKTFCKVKIMTKSCYYKILCDNYDNKKVQNYDKSHNYDKNP